MAGNRHGLPGSILNGDVRLLPYRIYNRRTGPYGDTCTSGRQSCIGRDAARDRRHFFARCRFLHDSTRQTGGKRAAGCCRLLFGRGAFQVIANFNPLYIPVSAGVDVVDRIVARISVAVLRQGIIQHAGEAVLCDEAAVLRGVIPRAQILQARERVLFLAVVPIERSLDAEFIGIDIAVCIVGVFLCDSAVL